MEKVNGIGGVFFRAKNPEELAAWYEKHLGVNPVPSGYDQTPWVQNEGPTVFAPFEHTTDYFGKDTQAWMINFRVGNLLKMVEQLRNAGIDVTIDEQEYPNGKFARLHDPEGNPVELWEPKV
ncbi:MAG: VOC family protein [Pseudomonadales bacterium]|nr:VOC family protein [Woeseia sp.]RZV49451.1 MAG: VOC family protein [Pseudomonadales bacterium]